MEVATGYETYFGYAKPMRKLCEYYAKSLGLEMREKERKGEREKERKREREKERKREGEKERKRYRGKQIKR